MKVLFSYPGNADFTQHAALALLEKERLVCFHTSFRYLPDGVLGRLFESSGSKSLHRVHRAMRRRQLGIVPERMTHTRPLLEILRSAALVARMDARIVDACWDWMSRDFTRASARLLARHGADAVYAYEYTALESFSRAGELGAKRILDLPSLSSRETEALLAEEARRFPWTASPEASYFEKRRLPRQARRDREIAMADLIVCNSTVTRASHVADGADPARTIVVPYGAPPCAVEVGERDSRGPLRLLWAGSFSARKGAHYLVEAWRRLPASVRSHCVIDVFGAMSLPTGGLPALGDGFRFHGSIPRDRLFGEMARSDMLMFPTLSDGFGMVVTEAFARGLPVLTTTRAGAADLVSDRQNGLLVPAGDAGALVDAIGWCLDNREALKLMRYEALATAAGRQWSDYRAELADKLLAALETA